jgi:putative glycerol-1-phosphate prenyltransferase
LIGHQVTASTILKQTQLEIISKGYILIESEIETAVEPVSKTKLVASTDLNLALNTALSR